MKGVIDVPSYEDLVVSGYARERHVYRIAGCIVKVL